MKYVKLMDPLNKGHILKIDGRRQYVYSFDSQDWTETAHYIFYTWPESKVYGQCEEITEVEAMECITDKSTYIFPAIFEPCEEGGYAVTFPDLPGCITEGDTFEETLHMSKEAMSLHLWNLEDDGDGIPKTRPRNPETLDLSEFESGSFVVPVEVCMRAFRERMAQKRENKGSVSIQASRERDGSVEISKVIAGGSYEERR